MRGSVLSMHQQDYPVAPCHVRPLSTPHLDGSDPPTSATCADCDQFTTEGKP
jgi:hypothetical protein